MSAKLTAYQLRALSEDFWPSDRPLWDALVDGVPVSITHLFRLRFDKPDIRDNRRKQQSLGTCFGRMNPLLEKHGLRIAPGTPRQTYQLREIA